MEKNCKKFFSIKYKTKECYQSKIEKNVRAFHFYLNGIKSMFSDGLLFILSQFDEVNEIPRRYRRVLDWPKVDFNPNQNMRDNLKKKIDFGKLFDKIVPGSQILPKWAKSIPSFLLNKSVCKVVGLVAENYLNGFTVVVNLLLEIIDGNMDHKQCLKCFEYNETVLNYDSKVETIYNLKEKFSLNYQAKYRVEDVDLFNETVSELKYGSIEYYMHKLKQITKENESTKSLWVILGLIIFQSKRNRKNAL